MAFGRSSFPLLVGDGWALGAGGAALPVGWFGAGRGWFHGGGGGVGAVGCVEYEGAACGCFPGCRLEWAGAEGGFEWLLGCDVVEPEVGDRVGGRGRRRHLDRHLDSVGAAVDAGGYGDGDPGQLERLAAVRVSTG